MTSSAKKILTVRVDEDLDVSLEREASRRRTSKSHLVRELLARGLEDRRGSYDLAEEARRQSLLASRRDSDEDVLAFLDAVAEPQGWESEG